MTRYELLLFLHVAAAVIWLGAGFLIAVLVFGAERAGNRQKEAGHHQDVAWLAPRLFVPASLATLIIGILLVVDGDWSLDQLWIVIGLVGWAIAFVLGFFYFRPEGERIGAMVAERGPVDSEVDYRIRRLNVVDRLQLTILFVVLAAMVIQPTGDDTATLVAGAAILLGGTAIAALAERRARTPGPAHRGAGP